MAENKVFSYPFADIYPLYLQKAQKKGRTKEEVDTVICWLTGYDEPGLARQLDSGADLKAFFENAPRINPPLLSSRGLSAVSVWRKSRIRSCRRSAIWINSLDELVKGKALEKILRS